MDFVFRKLAVYNKALDLLEKADVFSEDFPAKSRYLRERLLDRALMVAASIAESEGRRDTAERLEFFCRGRGALYESVCLIELAIRRNFLNPQAGDELIQDAVQVAYMLDGFIRHPGKGKAQE